MSLAHIIFALAIPAFIAAQTTHTLQTPANSTESPCNATQAQKINSTWIYMKQCYKSIIDHNLHSNGTFCKNMADLSNRTDEFLDASQCLSNDTERTNKTLNMFREFINFAITNNTFKDFIENNGSMCVRDNIKEIKTCIAREDIRNQTHFNHYYWLALDLDFKAAQCKEENSLKNCINNKIKKSTKCNERSINFINSLFDLVLKSCPAQNTTAATGSSEGLYSATNVILTAFAALAFI